MNPWWWLPIGVAWLIIDVAAAWLIAGGVRIADDADRPEPHDD